MLLTPHTLTTAKITQVWPVTSLTDACGQSPSPPPRPTHTLWSYSAVTSSACDLLVEKQLQKCQMCVTFSFLLNRSLEWSPLHQERKARLSFFHLAGKATCLLRGGVTMSTRPPTVSPALGSILHQPLGFCLFGGVGFLLPPSPSGCQTFSLQIYLRGCFPHSAGWWESENRLGNVILPGHIC